VGRAHTRRTRKQGGIENEATTLQQRAGAGRLFLRGLLALGRGLLRAGLLALGGALLGRLGLGGALLGAGAGRLGRRRRLRRVAGENLLGGLGGVGHGARALQRGVVVRGGGTLALGGRLRGLLGGALLGRLALALRWRLLGRLGLSRRLLWR
jgi:hypothetical protein